MEITMLDTIRQTAEYIRSKVGEMPDTAVILGTGLGDLVNHIEISATLGYQDTI